LSGRNLGKQFLILPCFLSAMKNLHWFLSLVAGSWLFSR
jgi:hypothetical protein